MSAARFSLASAFIHPLLPGFGYLIGPTVGSACWRMTHRKTMALIEAKDKAFHKHIVKNRVDPRTQRPTNPLPDFYGMF